MKISFDFDNTLSRKDVQGFCRELIHQGHDIWIVTSRVKEFNGVIHYHDDLMLVAYELRIPENKIHFTNAQFKASFLEQNNFIIHLDDDPFELIEIQKTKVVGISVKASYWMQKFERAIKEKI